MTKMKKIKLDNRITESSKDETYIDIKHDTTPYHIYTSGSFNIGSSTSSYINLNNLGDTDFSYNSQTQLYELFGTDFSRVELEMVFEKLKKELYE